MHPILQANQRFNGIISRYSEGILAERETLIALQSLIDYCRENDVDVPFRDIDKLMKRLRPEHSISDDFFIHHKMDFVPPVEKDEPKQSAPTPKFEGRTAEDEEALMREWAAMAGEVDDDTDAMVREWEAMLSSGEDEEEYIPPPRILNQDEIDSLLGFDDVVINPMEEDGDPEVVAYERAFADFCRMMEEVCREADDPDK